MFFYPLSQCPKLTFLVTVVETPLTFLQKEMKKFGRNTVDFFHVAFGLVPKVFDPINLFLAAGKQSGVLNPVVVPFSNNESKSPYNCINSISNPTGY
ncbi:protein of unknown function [Pseudodesulfovibrio profundus]|uniref:Uncharacterized protein n=1 Tax=Pseudodesulfovibrio profundus TaxID=57320 RepID=A0A2C8FFX9_9BACT|nr:protein of unknown function [Pseudodesulfovibrio profundus]